MSTGIVAITDDIAKELVGAGVSKDKIIQIPNGVKTNNAIHKSKGKCSCIYVGRLIKRKRVDWLIKAFSKSLCKSNFRLLIVGDGAEKKELEELCVHLKVNDQVDFLGELNHKDTITKMENSCIFILPSESEGMSNALLEGMASMNAVIASNIPANRGLISHRENGMLFTTVDQLEGVLNELCANPIYRDKLAKNAKENIISSYEFDVIAKHYIEYYKKILR